MNGTPEQNIEEILGMLDSLGETVSDNTKQAQANLVALKQMAAGMAEHKKRLDSMDKLIDAMVNCGTAKDLEKEIENLRDKITGACSDIADLIECIRTDNQTGEGIMNSLYNIKDSLEKE